MKLYIPFLCKLTALAPLLVILGACSDADFSGRSQSKQNLSGTFSAESSDVTIDGRDGKAAAKKKQGDYETDSVGDAAGKGPGQAGDPSKMKSCPKMALGVSHTEAENATGKGTADAEGDEVATYAEAGDGYVFACASSSSSAGDGTATAGSDSNTAK